jgi:hypothetical protein
LSIRQKLLRVIWRSQDVNVEVECYGGNESAAVRVAIGSNVVRAILLSGLPDDVMACQPLLFDRQPVQEYLQSVAKTAVIAHLSRAKTQLLVGRHRRSAAAAGRHHFR